MPDKRYKAPNGRIVTEKELSDKYGDRLEIVLSSNNFTEINEPVYKAPNGKLATESDLRNHYGEQFDSVIQEYGFSVEYSPKKKEESVSASPSPSTSPNQELVLEPASGSSDGQRPKKGYEPASYVDTTRIKRGQPVSTINSGGKEIPDWESASLPMESSIGAISDEDARTLEEMLTIDPIPPIESSPVTQDLLADASENVQNAYNDIRNSSLTPDEQKKVINAFMDEEEKHAAYQDAAFEKQNRILNKHNLSKKERKELQNLLAIDQEQLELNQRIAQRDIERIEKSISRKADVIDSIDEKLEKFEGKETLTEEERNEANQLLSRRNTLVGALSEEFDTFDERLNDFNNNIANLGTVEQEIATAKRNYGFWANTAGRAALGFRDLGAGIVTSWVDTKRRNRNVSIDYQNRILSQLVGEDFKNHGAISDETKRVVKQRFGLGDSFFLGITSENFEQVLSNYAEVEKNKNNEKYLNFVERSQNVDEYIREHIRPNIEVDKIKSFGDAVKFSIDGLAENTATLLLLSAGPGGELLFTGSHAANLAGEFKVDRRYGENFYTDAQIGWAALGMSASELAFHKYIGIGRQLRLFKRTMKSAGSKELKREVAPTVREILMDVGKGSGEIGKSIGMGIAEGFSIAFTHNTIRATILGEENVDFSEGMLDQAGGYISLNAILSSSRLIAGRAVGMYSDRSRRSRVAQNTRKIIDLEQELKDGDFSAEIRNAIEFEIEELHNNNAEIIEQVIDGFDGLSVEGQKRALEISNQVRSLEIALDQLPKNTDSTAKELMSNRLNDLEMEREQMLNQSKETMDEYEALSPEERQRYEDLAAKKMQESAERLGIKNYTFNEFQIRQTALAIFASGEVIDSESSSTETGEASKPEGAPAEVKPVETDTDVDGSIDNTVEYYDRTKNRFSEFESREETIGRLNDNLEGLEGQDRIDEANRIADIHAESYQEFLTIEGEPFTEADIQEYRDGVVEDLVGRTEAKSETEVKAEPTPEPTQSQVEAETESESETETDGDITDFIDVAPEEVTGFDNLLEAERKKLEELERKHGKNHSKTQEQRGILNALEKNAPISVEFKDGKTVVKGRGSDNPQTRREAVRKEVEKGLYDDAPQTDLRGVPEERAGEHIASHSENPIEVAQALEVERSQKTGKSQSMEGSIEDAIAYALGGGVSVDSYVDHTGLKGRDRPRGLTRSYLRKGARGLDMIAMEAEYAVFGDYDAQNPRVTTDMVVEFMHNNPSLRKFNNAKNKTEVEIDLEGKFRELTGLSPNKANLDMVIEGSKKPLTDETGTQDNVDSKPVESVDPTSKPETNLTESDTSSDAEFRKWYEANGGEALGSIEVARQEYDEMSQSERDNYVPFHKSEKFQSISEAVFKKLVDRLVKAFPSMKGKIVADGKAMRERLNELKEQGFDVQFLRTKEGDILGFLDPKNGNIYMDSARMNANTPIHEFGHLWTGVLKAQFPRAHKKLLDAVKRDKKAMDAVRNDPAYRHLKTEEEIAEEALARYIGDKGEQKFLQEEGLTDRERTIRQRIFDEIQRVWEGIKKYFDKNNKDIRKWTNEQWDNATMGELTEAITGELLGGKNIESKGVESKIREQQKELGVSFHLLDKSDFNADGTVKQSVLEAIAKEEAAIVSRAKADGTYMKAPNGKKSNLNEKQWVQVRTERFKEWFGDWENDPTNASKVVDSNGEPMVVYHGSDAEFNKFKPSYALGWGEGVYFTNNKNQAIEEFGSKYKEVFLNIRKPIEDNKIPYKELSKTKYFDEIARKEWNKLSESEKDGDWDNSYDDFKQNKFSDMDFIHMASDPATGGTDLINKSARELGYDGIIADGSNNIEGLEIVVFKPNQIKSATDNVGTFSDSTGDIRFQKESSKDLSKSEKTPIFNKLSKENQQHVDISYGSAEAFENNVNTVVNEVRESQLKIDFDSDGKGNSKPKWEKQYKLDFGNPVRHRDSDNRTSKREKGAVPKGRSETDGGVSKSDNRFVRTVHGELRGRTLLEGFQESGYVDFVGLKVETPQDIADLFLIHRSPLIEKGHIIYLKDGKILKTSAQTLGLTAGTTIDKNNVMTSTASALGADKVILLHNHPSGNHKPSRNDIIYTKMLSDRLGDRADLEHIVIDTDKFTLIERDGTYSHLDYKNKPKAFFSKRINLVEGGDPQSKLMDISISLSKGGAPNAIVYLAHNLTITGYDIIDGSENLAEYVRKNSKPQGATRFAVVSDGSTPAIESFANSNIKGLLTHIRITGESAFESVKDQGYLEGNDGKFVQLWENKTEYGTEAQTEKTRAEKFLDLLDSWESEIDKFGRETLGINIPAVVAKGMINMMRLTVKGGLNVTQAFNAGMDYIRETDWYKKLNETDKAKVDSNTFRTVITNAVRQAIDSENKLNKIREKLDELTKSQAEKPKTKTERKERVENEKRIRQEVVDDLVQFLSKNKIEGRITATEVNRLIRYAARIATDSNAHKAFDRFMDVFSKTEMKAIKRENSRNTKEVQRIDVTSRVDQMLNAGMNESDIINSFETKWQRDVAFDHIERQKDITDEEASKEWDRISEDYDKQFRSKKPLKKRAKRWVNAIRKALFSSQIHAEDLTTESGLRRTRNLLRNFHGAKGLAKTVFDDAYAKIWGVEGGKKGHWALKPKLRDALNDLIFHRRVIELENDYIAKGKEPVMHTGGWNKNKAEAKLREMKKELGEKTFNDLMRRSDVYFDVFKKLLKDKYDAGLISKESYESMKDLNYSPRMLASILLDFDGDLSERGKWNRSNRNGKTDAEIRSMGEGSLEHFFKESEWLLATALNSGYRNIAQNRLNNMLFREMKVQRERFEKIGDKIKNGEKLRRSEREFHEAYKELSEKIIDNPIVGFNKDGSPKYRHKKPPSHQFVESYRWVDGVRHSFFVESKLAEEWFANREGFLHPKAKWWISTLSGSRLVKYFATGNNPAFFISNTPRDMLYNYVFSDEFSPISIVGGAQMLTESIQASIDIIEHDFNLGDNLLEILYDYGLSMEFLSTQGRIESNLLLDLFPKNQRDNFQFVWRNLTLQQMQTANELMFRVGLAQRTIVNFLKQHGLKDVNHITEDLAKEKGYEGEQDMIDDMYETAVSQARGILDFSRGGWLSKDLEAFIPYTNVALQSTGKLLEKLHQNPVETTVKMAQVMGIMSTLPMMASVLNIALRYNPDEDEDGDGKWKSAFKIYFETMDGLSKYERTNYAHIPLGIKDENGNWMAIRIAKEHALSAPFAVSDYYTQNFIRKLNGIEEESISGLQSRLGFALRNNYAASMTPRDFVGDVPSFRAMDLHITGYDSFRDQYLPGTEAKVKYGIHSLQGEGLENPNVEEFWKAMGEQFYLSPIRTKYAVESIITSPSTNPMVGLIYGGADVVWSQDKTMREIRDGLVDNISKSPFKRVIISANDYNRGYADREAREKEDDKFRFKLQKRNAKENELIKEYMDGNISGEEFMKEAEKIRPEDPKKVRDKLKKRMKDKGVSWELLNLRSYSLEERARAIWQDYGDILDSSNKENLVEMRKAGGILTKNFWKYYEKEKKERMGE